MKELVIKFVKKYPFTFAFIIVLAFIITRMWALGDIFRVTITTGMIEESMRALSAIIVGSFLFSKVFENYEEKIPDKIKNNTIINNIVASALALIIYLLVRIIPNPVMTNTNYAAYMVTFVFSGLTYFFIVKQKKMQVSEYMLKVLMNSLAVFLFECVVVAGVVILFFIYDNLFKGSNWQLSANVMIFQSVIVGYIGHFASVEKVEGKLTLFSKILVKYVMFIMVFIGFIFFYMYLVKMIFERSIPSNQVFGVCTILFGLGLFISLISRSFDGDTIYEKIIESMPIAFIPALILQIISLGLRINQYGLTMSRYAGAVVIIFEIIYIVMYLVRYEKLHYMFVIGSIIVFVTTYVPFVNMYQFPDIYNKVFNVQLVKEEHEIDYDYTEKEKEEEEGKRKVRINQYYNIHDYDVEGYKKMTEAQVHINYYEKEQKWEYYHKTSEIVKSFAEVKIEDFDSNAFDTIDLTKLLNDIKDSIIKNDYTSNKEILLKDIDVNVINEDKKYIVNNMNIKFSEEGEMFTEIILDGYLLTK